MKRIQNPTRVADGRVPVRAFAAVALCLTALLACCALSGCGGTSTKATEKYVGNWQIELATSDTLSEAQVTALKTIDGLLGQLVVLTVDEGGSFDLFLAGDLLGGSWVQDGTSITLTFGDGLFSGQKLTAAVGSDSVMTITEDGKELCKMSSCSTTAQSLRTNFVSKFGETGLISAIEGIVDFSTQSIDSALQALTGLSADQILELVNSLLSQAKSK